jgi:hypothetical protein
MNVFPGTIGGLSEESHGNWGKKALISRALMFRQLKLPCEMCILSDQKFNT